MHKVLGQSNPSVPSGVRLRSPVAPGLWFKVVGALANEDARQWHTSRFSVSIKHHWNDLGRLFGSHDHSTAIDLHFFLRSIVVIRFSRTDLLDDR